jgi:hypothetical protein
LSGGSTKALASASHHSNVAFDRLTRAILSEADRVDREQDDVRDVDRGDELLEQLHMPEGHRKALRDAS